MKPNTRSASGALLMLVIIPVIVGLLACMPVPIGDPERSRIDPDITGVWVVLDESADQAFYAFEPYDKRTWLVTGVPIEEGDDADLGDYELQSYADLAALIENTPVGRDGVSADNVENFKVWKTKLGGEWFMTWEPKTVFGNESFSPETWWVFRINRPDENSLDLTMLDDELFDGIEETRRAYERVVKKNARNDELYSEEKMRLIRVKPEHLPFFRQLAGEVIVTD
ncbi:MAG: hypothetical protein OEO71_08385 [Gammaproteobacteria bacterium]|nr:hypothetical protein [Gammaproteobacteria bacterium]